MRQVQALFTARNGIYPQLLSAENCWDEQRDARGYLVAGNSAPVVAHPPCARWCKLAGLVHARYPHCVPGDDGGCFAAALAAVEQCGGVLEHPAYSKAWPAYGLDRPRPGGWQSSRRGWVTQVSQCVYGHRAQKRTWLYYVSMTAPPDLDWREPKTTAYCSHLESGNGRRYSNVKRLSAKERNATPQAFAELLIRLAEGSRK